MPLCETRTPANCSETELDEFRKLAISAGKVQKHGLPELIGEARLLAFLREGGRLIGVAGLKRPRDSYRAKIEAKSGVPLPEATYPYELGWVSVLPDAEGGKAKLLCEPLLAQISGEGAFSTTGVANEKMRARLGKMGFVEEGDTWKSSQGDETLSLFTRAPVINGGGG
jgi:hypothetical protein